MQILEMGFTDEEILSQVGAIADNNGTCGNNGICG